MKNILKISFICFTIIALASSCSKDKKIEKQLSNNGGKWKITSVDYTLVDQNSSSGQSVKTGTADNAGTFTFNDSGSGSFSYTVEGSLREGEFSWTVSDETITLSKTSQTVDFSTGGFNQTAIAYSGSQGSKTELTIEGSETNQYASGGITQSVFTGTFKLTKE